MIAFVRVVSVYMVNENHPIHDKLRIQFYQQRARDNVNDTFLLTIRICILFLTNLTCPVIIFIHFKHSKPIE